ncbi:MAM and LDL-receptor class A domain-containing protein 2-like isoform X3, partial [Biomphalaria pfeifferi]
KHLYMDASGKQPSSLAYLKTGNFTGYAPCVSFWYGLAGIDVNRLIVYVRQPGQYDSIIWTKSGNIGQHWNHQMLQLTATFNDTGSMVPMQVIFEGVVGQSSVSDIDLDDIFVYNQDCPPSDFCDFEDSTLCNIDQDNMDSGNYILFQKAGDIKNSYALSSDHTYQTGEGHYALVTFNDVRTGSKSRLVFPMMVSDNVQCLNFWFYINNLPSSPDSHIIRVLARDERGVETVAAKLSGRDSGDWTPAHVSVSHIITKKLQIIIETEAHSGFGAIGLDDIQFSQDECYNLVNCQFESGTLCNWHQDQMYPTPPWQAVHNETDPDGYYMSVHFTDQLPDRPAVSAVVSELTPNTALENFCFMFRYKILGSNTSVLNVSLLDVTKLDQFNAAVQIFSTYGNPGNNQWNRAFAQKPDGFKAAFFKFVIAATSGSTSASDLQGQIMVTDIQLSPHKCTDERNTTFFCSQNTKITLDKVCDFRNDCPGPQHDDEMYCGACNFESNFCQWLDDGTGSSHFMLGLNLSSTHLPDNNHGSDGGNYLYIEGTSDSSQEDIDLVLTQALGPSPPSCYLHFHYYMNSEPNIALGDLLVVIEENDEETIVWRALRVTSPVWHEADVPIDNIHSRFEVHFRLKNLAYQQYVAVDDIKLNGCSLKEPAVNVTCDGTQFKCTSSGACLDSTLLCDFNQDCLDGSDEEDNLCESYTMDDFEHSLGNWLQSSNDDFDWSRHEGQGVNLYNGPRRDHTLGTHFGHYMLLEASGHRSGQTAQLLSPVFAPTVQSGCWVMFYIYMFGPNSADFRLTTRTSQAGPHNVLLEINEGFKDTWWSQRIHLQSTENFQVVLEGITTGVSSLNIAVDDISFSPQCHLAASQTLPVGQQTSTPPPKCPYAMFTCNAGSVKCINASEVCDFVAQCEDSSDERECGPCTFETDECGWFDESIGNKMWTLVKDSSLGSPLDDHTFGIPGEGSYLSVVDGLGDTQLPALLVGPTMPSTGADCSMNVYILKESGNINGTIELGLRDGKDPFKTIVTSVQVKFGCGHPVGQWTKYSYHIGSLPAGYQAFIQAVNVTSRQPGLTFNIDDIVFENCQQNATTNISSVNCDFESGWCGYFNNYSQNGQWLLANKDMTLTKVGPEHDHTTGSGYFAYVNLESGYRYREVTGQLVTGLLDPGTMRNGCLSFFYHTFGTLIELDVYIIQGGVSQRLFVQSHTENSWKLGQASIMPTGLFQISFVGKGTMTQIYGHIALDDITLDSGPCPATMECNFELDMCGYYQSTTDQQDWSRIQASSVSEGDPTVDYTTRTPDGHYIKMSAGTPGDHSVLISPLYSGQSGLMCLTFWYYVELGKNASTEVFYWPNGSRDHSSSIWTSVGSFPRWMFAQSAVNVTSQFKISFEGRVPLLGATSFSVDDIRIENGQCPPIASCDFERDSCGFTTDLYYWFRSRGQMGPGDPPVDHTTGTSKGFFVSLYIKDASHGGQFELRSQWINATHPVCVSFWYYVNSASASLFNLLVSTSSLEDPLDRQAVYNLTDLQSDKWQKFQVTITKTEPYYFVIAGVVVQSKDGTLALDDMLVSDGTCDQRIISTIPPLETKTFPPSSLDCTFDSLCQWTQSSSDNFDWMITSKSPFKFSGMSYDHTSDSAQGSFIMTNPATKVSGQFAQLFSPALNDLSKGLCFKFWYFMSGPSAGSLNIKLLKDSQTARLLWHRDGEQAEDWLYATIYVSPDELTSGQPKVVNLVLENILASEYPEDIRIDDVSANSGQCWEEMKHCDFESTDLCGFAQDSLDNGEWILSQGQNASNTSIPGPLVDHTYGTPYGHYLYIQGSQFKTLNRAGVISKTLGPVQSSCLRFYYHMFGDNMGTLSVKCFTEEGDVTLIWSREGNSGDTWRSAYATLDSDVSFQLAFEAVVKSSQLGNIAIDDISILNTACPQPASCDFETDLCSYQNVKEADDFDWLRHSGPTLNDGTGPSRDHTTNTSNGHYIYTLNVLRHHGKSARLASEILPQTDGSCLSFFYHMLGQGTLLIWLDFNMNHLLSTITEDTGDHWKQKSLNITTDTEFVIIFESQILIEGQADTAIDDISYTPGLCTSMQETQMFVCSEDGKAIDLNKRCNFIKDCLNGSDEVHCGNCSFQSDLCGYREASEGSFHWVIASNHTMKHSALTSGLGYDHTLNSPYGNMLFVDSLSGRDMAVAILQSPLLQTSYKTCQLEFYYKFSEPLAGEITVALKFDWSTGLFPTSFSQNRVYNLDSWHLAQVDIGYVADSFNILILAKKSFLSRGTIAIDDISLVNCGPPLSSPLVCSLWSSQMPGFQCANGYCVDQKVVCDLTQDCGDGSDEKTCQNVKACDFENSLCDWIQESSTDLFWRFGTGVNHDTPVSRDHTLGMASGHYIYTSYSLGLSFQERSKARLVSPVFQASASKTCQLTLYYYMLKNLNNSLTLSVSLRTAQGGYETKLFSHSRGDFTGWERYVIPIISPQNFLLTLEVVPGTGAKAQAVVALDDLVFSSGCQAVLTPLPTPGYTLTTQPVTPFRCLSGQHQCPDGKCIQAKFICDLKPDCADGSDETNCGPCEFETGACGWYSTSTGSLDWALTTPDVMVKVGPTVDTTYNNSTGHYLYIKSAYGLGVSAAMMTSGPLPPIIRACTITLEYYVNPSISGHMSLLINDQGSAIPLMTVQVDQVSSTGWQLRTYSFVKDVDEGSQLILKFDADNINGSQNIAAVDSIKFHGCSKQEEVVSLTCDFDFKNLCSWKQSSKDVFDWIYSGSNVFTPNGPKRDHSFMGSGYYLLARSLNRHQKDTTGLLSPELPPSGLSGNCLSFWYFMNGADVGSLRVETYSDRVNNILYEREGSSPNHWIQALVPVKSLDTFSIGIKAEVTGGFNGDIAIDDIQFKDGACASPNECMYEDNNFCDWYEKAGDTIYWALGSKSTAIGSIPPVDHTLDTVNGHFAYVETITPGTATLRSTLRLTAALNATLCVQFWYHMVSVNSTQLNISATLQDGQTRNFLSLHGPSDDLWRKASAPITPITGVYELQITAAVHGGVGHVAIDDLLLQDGHCPAPGTCSFEKDMCSFTPMSRGGDFEWVLHSDEAEDNSYVFIQATNTTNINDAAVLLSEVISFNHVKVKCLQFRSQLRSSLPTQPSLQLHIYSRDVSTNLRNEIETLKTFSLNKWTVYQITFEVLNDFELFLESDYLGHSSGGLALDDISLKDNQCTPTTVSPSQTSSSLPATEPTQRCAGTTSCQLVQNRCAQQCDGIKDCTDGSDELNCIASTVSTSKSMSHVTNEQQSQSDENSDSWKLPVGLVLGALFGTVVTVLIIVFLRHKRRIPFQALESERVNQTLSNPAFMYDTDNQGKAVSAENFHDLNI